jgi:hypothetical protein
MDTNTALGSRGALADERVQALILGALASWIPVLLAHAQRGEHGLLVETAVLFGASLLLCRVSETPLRPGVLLLVGAVAGEAVSEATHAGLGIVGGVWAPAGAQMLAAVPAVLAGGSIGVWLREPEAGVAIPLVSMAVGCASCLALAHGFLAVALFLVGGSAAAAVLRPQYALLWSSLIAGTTSLLAVVALLGKGGGPGNLWPVVLALQAIIVTPLAYVGGVIGLLIARSRRRDGGSTEEQS